MFFISPLLFYSTLTACAAGGWNTMVLTSGRVFAWLCAETGFLALLALAIYTGVTVNFFGKRYIDWRFSWSYILGWLGIILSLTAGNANLATLLYYCTLIMPTSP